MVCITPQLYPKPFYLSRVSRRIISPTSVLRKAGVVLTVGVTSICPMGLMLLPAENAVTIHALLNPVMVREVFPPNQEKQHQQGNLVIARQCKDLSSPLTRVAEIISEIYKLLIPAE
jgi:predicted transcriptional regulator with HTH domain